VVSFRGDAHKFYLKLKETKKQNKQFTSLEEIKEVQAIYSFYLTLEDLDLHSIRYRMIKEKNGTGIVPILVTAAPWLLFIFSKQLQALLFQKGSHLWVGFIVIYLTAMISSIIIHFREKAWSALHIEMIEDILRERGDLE
jgi:hypothetical protein